MFSRKNARIKRRFDPRLLRRILHLGLPLTLSALLAFLLLHLLILILLLGWLLLLVLHILIILVDYHLRVFRQLRHPLLSCMMKEQVQFTKTAPIPRVTTNPPLLLRDVVLPIVNRAH